MKFKANYLFIPLTTILVAVTGSILTQSGMPWYETLIKPNLTPAKWVFPVAWNLIFLLTTISALILWNKLPHQAHNWKKLVNWLFHRKDQEAIYFKTIFILFSANAILNVLWSYFFFNQGQIGLAFAEMPLLLSTLIALMILTYRKQKVACLLLAPYTLWVSFASYLTYQIWLLN